MASKSKLKIRVTIYINEKSFRSWKDIPSVWKERSKENTELQRKTRHLLCLSCRPLEGSKYLNLNSDMLYVKAMKYLTFLPVLCPIWTASEEATWRGIRIAKEERCSPYNRSKDYPYSQSIEEAIVKSQNGQIYCPYTGKFFHSTKETDIEHIVSLSEAHDSGLCAASAEIKKQFASDIINLTLAGPTTNRQEKKGHDAGEWMPENNKCWYIDRIIKVKKAYNLSVNPKELVALEEGLLECDSFLMVFKSRPSKKALRREGASFNEDPSQK